MRDTVWAIILTQTPIAVACLWVAVEMRGIRRSLEGAERLLSEMAATKDQDPKDLD